MDGLCDDMKIKGVNMEMTSDRREWKKKTCADPTLWDKGTMIMTYMITAIRFKFGQTWATWECLSCLCYLLENYRKE
jgi:hypothetical protein